VIADEVRLTPLPATTAGATASRKRSSPMGKPRDWDDRLAGWTT
jgi:hypothetical protein